MISFQDIKKNKYLSNALAFFMTLIIYAGKLFTKKESSKKAAVIVLHKLGDSVFTIPTLKLLKKHYGQITIICFSENVAIYRLVFPDDPVVEVGHNEFMLGGRIAKQSVRKKIKSIGAGTIIDLTGSIISASVLFGINANKVVGLNESIYKAMYTELIPIRKEPHIIDLYLDVVKNIMPFSEDISLKTFPVEIKRDGYILIHPFAGWAAKEWNIEKFIDLAEKLNKKYKVVIVSEPGKLNAEHKENIDAYNIKLKETKSIIQLIEVIKGCSFIISNDSGPLYIASMLGKPTFTIFGPTNPEYHLSYGNRHRFIQNIVSCSPKENEKYCSGWSNCKSYECIRTLSSSEVYEETYSFAKELEIQLKST